MENYEKDQVSEIQNTEKNVTPSLVLVGSDLINNLIDELNRTQDLLYEISDKISEEYKDTINELKSDIEIDLDRYYDYADAINSSLEDIEIETAPAFDEVDNENYKENIEFIQSKGELMAVQSTNTYYGTIDLPSSDELYKFNDNYYLVSIYTNLDRENDDTVCITNCKELDYETAKQFIDDTLANEKATEHINEKGVLTSDEYSSVTSAGKLEFDVDDENKKKKLTIER